jgi:hypothetical protein
LGEEAGSEKQIQSCLFTFQVQNRYSILFSCGISDGQAEIA